MTEWDGGDPLDDLRAAMERMQTVTYERPPTTVSPAAWDAATRLLGHPPRDEADLWRAAELELAETGRTWTEVLGFALGDRPNPVTGHWATTIRHDTGGWMFLCSCGAEGPHHGADRSEAYRDKARHERDAAETAT